MLGKKPKTILRMVGKYLRKRSIRFSGCEKEMCQTQSAFHLNFMKRWKKIYLLRKESQRTDFIVNINDALKSFHFSNLSKKTQDIPWVEHYSKDFIYQNEDFLSIFRNFKFFIVFLTWNVSLIKRSNKQPSTQNWYL